MTVGWFALRKLRPTMARWTLGSLKKCRAFSDLANPAATRCCSDEAARRDLSGSGASTGMGLASKDLG